MQIKFNLIHHKLHLIMKSVLFFITIFCLTACVKKASNEDVSQKNPNIYTTQVGNYKVHLLSEGQQQGKTEILIGATSEMQQEYIPSGTFPNAINAFLIQTPERNILVDTGLGKSITENLQSLGVAESDITDVLITHMHGDHVGGLFKDENPRFPEANLKISVPEYDYWFNSDQSDKLTQITKSYPKFSAFSPEIFAPGNDAGFTLVQDVKINPIPAYGHTPGHVAFLLESKGEKLLIWGDLTHAMAIQMPHPEIAVTYDVNTEDAINSRNTILEYVTKNNIPIAGMHIAYPAMGNIKKKNGQGYEFLPL